MAAGKLVIGTELDTKKFEKQLEQLEKEQIKLKDKKVKLDLDSTKAINSIEKIDKQISLLEQKLFDIRNVNINYESDINYQELLNKEESLIAKREEYAQKLDLIKDKEREINNQLAINETAINNISEQIKKIQFSGNFTSIENGFKKLLKSAKKLTMGIIGVRAAYSLIRKAASSYLQDNENTASKTQNLWTGLGTLMGDIIEGIVSLLKKAVTAILYFASVLTGVNYIAKANAAILKKQTKATKSLRKEQDKLTASFDEMEILRSNSSNDSNAGGNVSGDLFDINELGRAKEVIERIATALKPIWDIVKGIVDFSIKHPEALLAIIGGTALLKMLAKVIGYAGVGAAAGTGLAGVLSLLTAIAAIGVITITIKTIIKDWNETKKYVDEIKEQTKAQSNVTQSIQEQTNALKLNNEQVNKAVGRAKAAVKLAKDRYDNNVKELRSWNDLEHAVFGLVGTERQLAEANKTQIKTMYEQVKILENLKNKNQLNDEQTQVYKDTVKTLSKVIDDANLKFMLYGDAVSHSNAVFPYYKEDLKDFSEIVKHTDELMLSFGKDTTKTTENVSGIVKAVLNLKDNAITTLKIAVDDKESNKKLTGIANVIETLKKNYLTTLKIDADTSKATKAIENLIPKIKSNKILTKTLEIAGIKLATGGIINRPGKGVPLGGVVGGEVSREGVVPLTDAQAMSQLGYEIGRNVNINATIPVQIGNKMVAQEIRKINAEDDFAFNR